METNLIEKARQLALATKSLLKSYGIPRSWEHHNFLVEQDTDDDTPINYRYWQAKKSDPVFAADDFDDNNVLKHFDPNAFSAALGTLGEINIDSSKFDKKLPLYRLYQLIESYLIILDCDQNTQANLARFYDSMDSPPKTVEKLNIVESLLNDFANHASTVIDSILSAVDLLYQTHGGDSNTTHDSNSEHFTQLPKLKNDFFAGLSETEQLTLRRCVQEKKDEQGVSCALTLPSDSTDLHPDANILSTHESQHKQRWLTLPINQRRREQALFLKYILTHDHPTEIKIAALLLVVDEIDREFHLLTRPSTLQLAAAAKLNRHLNNNRSTENSPTSTGPKIAYTSLEEAKRDPQFQSPAAKTNPSNQSPPNTSDSAHRQETTAEVEEASDIQLPLQMIREHNATPYYQALSAFFNETVLTPLTPDEVDLDDDMSTGGFSQASGMPEGEKEDGNTKNTPEHPISDNETHILNEHNYVLALMALKDQIPDCTQDRRMTMFVRGPKIGFNHVRHIIDKVLDIVTDDDVNHTKMDEHLQAIPGQFEDTRNAIFQTLRTAREDNDEYYYLMLKKALIFAAIFCCKNHLQDDHGCTKFNEQFEHVLRLLNVTVQSANGDIVKIQSLFRPSEGFGLYQTLSDSCHELLHPILCELSNIKTKTFTYYPDKNAALSKLLNVSNDGDTGMTLTSGDKHILDNTARNGEIRRFMNV